MDKKLALTLLLTCSTLLQIQAYRTSGNGTTYSFEKLAQTDGAGVTKQGDNTYIVNGSDTIDAADRFVIDKNATVKFGHQAELVILGEADLAASDGESTTLTAINDENATPYGLLLCNETGAKVQHLIFNKVGLSSMSSGAVNVSDCVFTEHNGSQAAALYFIMAGQLSTIERCYFEECQKATIGSAANASQPLVIKECTLVKNSRANNNIPQINIAAAESIDIVDCQIFGDPENIEANNMVGGIGISNFMGFVDTRVLIQGCDIEENRYGIGTVGPVADLRIEGCLLKNNHHEANAMNGGSGISLYDPYLQTKAMITKNQIEGNLWGVTVIGCADVNLGRIDVSEDDENYNPGGNQFANNGNNDQLYDLYNNSANTVYAQNNWWNVSEQTEEQIETVIYHQHDDPSLGEVIFMPASSLPGPLGIETVGHADSQASQVYDLQGRRVTNTSNAKGIYIVNGKKVVF